MCCVCELFRLRINSCKDLFQMTFSRPLSHSKTKVTYGETDVPFFKHMPSLFHMLLDNWLEKKQELWLFFSSNFAIRLLWGMAILKRKDSDRLEDSLQTFLETPSLCLLSQEVPRPCQLPQHKETEPGWNECSHVCPQNLASFPSYITSAFQSYHKQCWNFILVPLATVHQNIG